MDKRYPGHWFLPTLLRKFKSPELLGGDRWERQGLGVGGEERCHFLPEAKPGCKEATLQTVAVIRQIRHLSGRSTCLPALKGRCKLSFGLGLPGPVTAVPASFRDGHVQPASHPNPVSRVWCLTASEQEASESLSTARPAVLCLGHRGPFWKLSTHPGGVTSHL